MGLAHSLKQFSNFVSLSIVHAQHKVRVCTLGNIKLDIMLNDRMRAKFLVSIHLYNSFFYKLNKVRVCILGNIKLYIMLNYCMKAKFLVSIYL